jgi:Ca-activated chloride channel family protein
MNNWTISILDYQLLAPQWLLLLLLVPLYGYYLFLSRNKNNGTWKFTGTPTTQTNIASKKIKHIRIGLNVSSLIGFVLLLITLAQPTNASSEKAIQNQYKNGIDIVLAMDVSLSMYALDFQPNRLEVAKSVAKEFIDGRNGDRIGLVVFSGEAYTACPTTLDYQLLKDQMGQINGEDLESGTAIGTGLGTAVARLRDDKLKSKVIILLTDGSNNAGELAPKEAAELARLKNITVYTIGVGSNGNAPTPIVTPFGVRFENMPVEIDEQTLREIAAKTNGRYFRATDAKSLTDIYAAIDQMEKRKMKDQNMQLLQPINANPFLTLALLLLILPWLFNNLFFQLND